MTSDSRKDDERFLRRALELAERGRGHVEPNPLVGAVVVRAGEIVGEGWHRRFGGPHAEVIALDQAGPRARGAELYVSLEPCCHQGKTPPCTERIIAAGVGRLVAAMQDPFAQVAGKGLRALRDAGIDVADGPAPQSPLYRDACRLNAPYLKRLATGLPYVHAKWAMSLDGKIATATGDSQWITGEASRRLVHELRGRVDAIVVGLGTVRADDPMLTARPPGPRVAARVVLDSQARLAGQMQLVRSAREVPVIVATTHAAPARELERLQAAGCECLVLAEDPKKGTEGMGRHGSKGAPHALASSFFPTDGRTPIVPLLEALGSRGMSNVLVEGGSAVLGSFFAAGQIDAAHVFLAPKLIGGTAGKSPLGGPGLARLELARQLEIREVTRIGEDVYVHAETPFTHRPL